MVCILFEDLNWIVTMFEIRRDQAEGFVRKGRNSETKLLSIENESCSTMLGSAQH
jgi:hypothetical protein